MAAKLYLFHVFHVGDEKSYLESPTHPVMLHVVIGKFIEETLKSLPKYVPTILPGENLRKIKHYKITNEESPQKEKTAD